MLWSSLRLPPGVDVESKLSNMFVFDFALLTAMKFNLVVSGIPVHGRVMKPRFQNMENWSDVLDFLTNHELIMVLICWFLWVSARAVYLPERIHHMPIANSSGSAIHAWNSLIGSFWQFWISPGVSNHCVINNRWTSSYELFRFRIQCICCKSDTWAIERTS